MNHWEIFCNCECVQDGNNEILDCGDFRVDGVYNFIYDCDALCMC